MHPPVHLRREIEHHVVHQAAVVEHDDVADPPPVAVDEARLHRVLVEEREQGVTEQVVARQLDAVVEHCGIDAVGEGVIAYEPVWAIGTGKTATPEQAQEVHAFIRGRLAAASQAVADAVRVLYGGSMNPKNAAELLAQPDIDGGLIGGASLKAEDFLAVCTAANR